MVKESPKKVKEFNQNSFKTSELGFVVFTSWEKFRELCSVKNKKLKLSCVAKREFLISEIWIWNLLWSCSSVDAARWIVGRQRPIRPRLLRRRDVSGLTPRGPRVRVLRVNRQARHLSSDLERRKEIHVFGNVEWKWFTESDAFSLKV